MHLTAPSGLRQLISPVSGNGGVHRQSGPAAIFHELIPVVKSSKPDASAAVSLTDDVYHRILLQIIRCELPSGTELKSTQLAREMGVSRTPVVQALGRLTADGIVEQERNQRAIVRDGAENWLAELHDLRILLEPAAAARAAQNISGDAVTELQKLATLAKPGKNDAWMPAGREFDYALHLAVAEHARNLPLREAIRKCWSYKQISYASGQDTSESLKRDYDDHCLILEALEKRDAELASAAMLIHLHVARRVAVDVRFV